MATAKKPVPKAPVKPTATPVKTPVKPTATPIKVPVPTSASIASKVAAETANSKALAAKVAAANTANTIATTPTPASVINDTTDFVNQNVTDDVSIANSTGEASIAENNATAGASDIWTPITSVSNGTIPGNTLQPAEPSNGGTGTPMSPKDIQDMIDAGIKSGLAGLQTKTNTDPNPDYVAAITSLLSSYGIGDLSGSVVNAVQKGYTPDTINLIMQDPTSSDPLALAYQKRFPANQILFKSGKSVLSPAQYLSIEDQYRTILQSHGLSQYATPDKFTDLISKSVSPTEVNDRILLGVDRVQNADQNTKDALKQFYPSLNPTDILGAVLDTSQGLPDLQRKVQIGEIGGAALAQSLEASATADKNTMGASALADLGVTKAQAQTGYGNIGTYLPTAQKLSDIYAGQTAGYNQATAEGDVFQNLASAQRARQNLDNLEVGSFTGSSGTLGPSYGTPRSSFNDLTPGQI